ncbi:MAG: tetratricopeptide repeat protein [Pseudomonadota bacterium]
MKKHLFAISLACACSLPLGATAGFVEGANAYNAKNYVLALKEVAPLAKAGHADAQHLLGLMHYMGRGVERDYKLALQWHRKAAQQGKADAQYVVGAMFYTGNAVPKDQLQALMWFRKAAEQGHADAQHTLGLMYCYRIPGVRHDVVIAYMLYNLSAANGNKHAAEQRSAITRRMTQEQIDEAQSMSRAWKPGSPLPTKSVTGGDPA